jgi:hypothetical protein
MRAPSLTHTLLGSIRSTKPHHSVLPRPWFASRRFRTQSPTRWTRDLVQLPRVLSIAVNLKKLEFKLWEENSRPLMQDIVENNIARLSLLNDLTLYRYNCTNFDVLAAGCPLLSVLVRPYCGCPRSHMLSVESFTLRTRRRAWYGRALYTCQVDEALRLMPTLRELNRWHGHLTVLSSSPRHHP